MGNCTAKRFEKDGGKEVLKGYFFGFSRWKRNHIRYFFYELDKKQIVFVNSVSDALRKGLDIQSSIYIWGKKPFKDVETYAIEYGIPLYRVEDGFIRSISLGSDLTKGYSLVVDSNGIYFDPTEESDLEILFNTYHFDQNTLERAKKIKNYLLKNKISKYNNFTEKTLVLDKHEKGQRIILVPGQVEDDASVQYGAEGMTNLEFLKTVKRNAPDAYIIYRPHPDVIAGNRVGHINEKIVECYCNAIISKVDLDSVFALTDEVHTMTSLVGFEGLLRGKKVYTYGMPFYAGWGLTIDSKICKRRKRRLSLEALIAGAYIVYPRYIHPKNNKQCEIEELLKVLIEERERYNTQKIYRSYINIRNMISRKIQLLIRIILNE